MSIDARAGGYKLTCILPAGRGHDIIERLRGGMGVDTAVLFHARGTSEHSGGLGWHMGDSLEKDILYVIAEDDQAQILFEFLYGAARIDEPHHGLLFMEALGRHSIYHLPELPEEVS